MEQLVPTFMRILRNIDDPSTLQATLQQVANAKPTQRLNLSDTERRRILDIPEAEAEQNNIAASSSSTKQELLARAANLPDRLSQSEIQLLMYRYWADVTVGESMARLSPCILGDDDTSRENLRLECIRDALYEENEKEAFQNAGNESWRRWREESKRKIDEDARWKLEKAEPWIHKLWEEEKEYEMRRPWGYAVYWSPDCADTTEREREYEINMHSVLISTKSQISLPDVLGYGWTLEKLDWPADHVDFAQDLEERLGALRKHFREVRALPPNRKHTSLFAEKTDGLPEGIQRDVFLYVDKNCVDSTLDHSRGMGNMDDMWVYAVDPDYTPNPNETDGYKGYLRVLLQQIMHRFFEARRFHADEYPMEYLWRASLKAPRTQAFMSIYDDELDDWEDDLSTEHRLFGIIS